MKINLTEFSEGGIPLLAVQWTVCEVNARGLKVDHTVN